MTMGGIFGGGTPTPPAPAPPVQLAPLQDAKTGGGKSSDEARRRALLAAGLRKPTGPRGLLSSAKTTGKSLLGN